MSDKPIKSTKKSVRLAPESIDVIYKVGGEDLNWSAAVNSVMSRYMTMVSCLINNIKPDLSKNQILAIYQAYNGKQIEPQNFEREAEILSWQIDQSIQYDTNVSQILADEHDMTIEQYMDSNHLVNFMSAVEKWTLAERMAVLHKVWAFWVMKRLPHNDERVEKSGYFSDMDVFDTILRDVRLGK